MIRVKGANIMGRLFILIICKKWKSNIKGDLVHILGKKCPKTMSRGAK